MEDKAYKDLLNRLNEKEFSINQLTNYLNNIQKSELLDDERKKILTDLISKKIRIKNPKKASNVLGNKDEKAKILLEESLNYFVKKFDLTDNKDKPTIKPGGSMIKGDDYVCYYISYKNPRKERVAMVYRHDNVENDPFIIIEYKITGSGIEPKQNLFKVLEIDDAINLYERYLSKMTISIDQIDE